MLRKVTHVIPLAGYKLALEFDTLEKRIFDMSPYLDTGIFRELRDEKQFSQARVSWGTVEWTNGADIDPETLYTDSIEMHSVK